MACDIDDREGESPSPMEPGWGGCSTARRPVAAVNKLFLRRSVFVKRFIREIRVLDHQDWMVPFNTSPLAALKRASAELPAVISWLAWAGLSSCSLVLSPE